MELEEYNGFKLGCLVPETFPTMFAKTDASVPMLTGDQIRAELAKRTTEPRRTTFGPDWIGNQGRVGACNGFSCAKALERLRWLRGLRPRIKLSGFDAYSQMNGGRDQGSALGDGMKILGANGVSPEELNPSNAYYTNQIPAAAKAARSRFKGFECFAVDDELELATGLLLGFVGVVAVHAGGSFDRLDGNGISQGGNGPGNHSVGVDDVKLAPDGTLLFDMFNSWTTNWGDRGRCYLTWNRQLRQTVTNHRFFLVGSTTDDPQGESPPAAVA